jgi:DNA-binding transcriptional regulator YiaG
MSTNSELRARLARLGPIRDTVPARSSSAEREPLYLRRIGRFERRVTLFRRLFDEGITARAAKDAIDALASQDEAVCLIPSDADMDALARDLRALDVEMHRRRTVADPAAFIIAVRARHNLSQREFADRLGLDVRTLQNWEQGRNRPDDTVLAFIRLFDADPDSAHRAVFEPVAVSA